MVKYELTIDKKFAEEKTVKKEIDEKQKIAIQKSKEDPLYNTMTNGNKWQKNMEKWKVVLQEVFYYKLLEI
ncbi:hypothetical protein [Fusobacterium polymorphum]|uniref:hypothetical protein n=1 Tax=Fusobacterium nucleatum subsp. polymorphum TaxID=76857 RepID=UPI003008E48C